MGNGYSIFWTDHALKELSETYHYLEIHFTQKELKKLSIEIEKTLKLISKTPDLFPLSEYKNIHRVVILKYNSMYYRKINRTVEILSFFSNRKNPNTDLF
jgi:plasmid stabilization system protein ParE